MFCSVSYKWVVCAGDFSGDIDTELLLKEFKRTLAQEKFDKELREIDKRLEQKEVKRSPMRGLLQANCSLHNGARVPDLLLASCSLGYLCVL